MARCHAGAIMNGIKVKMRVDCGRVTYVPINDAALALAEIAGT